MPPIESVGEFKVQTNNYDAAYGRTGGGVVAIATKSGTNSFHGSLFEFYRGSALSANSWEANSLGQPRTRAVNNNFGVHLDGPIFIPKLFDGRNRLFFLVSYDISRSRGVGTASAIMPDAAMRSGDFSHVPAIIYDPLTTRQQLLSPFPQYRSVTMSEISIGRSHYHSFQSQLLKRFSHGLTMTVSYTIGKSLEEITFLNPQDFNLAKIEDSKLHKVLSLYDAPQKLGALATSRRKIGNCDFGG